MDALVTDEMMCEILKWAYQMAYRYVIPCEAYDYDDMAQEAVMAILPSLSNWDPQRASLFTFVYDRLRGAMWDYIRQYRRARPEYSFRSWYLLDHKAIRFSEMERHQSSVIENSERLNTLNVLSGPSEDQSECFEAIDFLVEWRKKNRVSPRQWTILLCRYGLGLSHAETGSILGITHSRVSQLEVLLRKRFNLPQLPHHPTRASEQIIEEMMTTVTES